MALPAHACDRLKPIAISVFAPFKHYTKEALEKTVLRLMRQMSGEYTLTEQELWNGILGRYKNQCRRAVALMVSKKQVCGH